MPLPIKEILRRTRILYVLLLWMTMVTTLPAQHKTPVFTSYDSIMTGAQRTELYLPLLEGKAIAVVANHTSLVEGRHLVDTLVSAGVDLRIIMSPEHGFRGDHADGALVSDGRDELTGVPVISLYGDHKKPTEEDLEGIDMVVYDIQDVGVRCYTYVSTMSLVMASCAESGIPLIILDRPNPNGFYIDGPLLDTAWSSFVGMHPVPLVYGMTAGEYAGMANEEGWLGQGLRCEMTIIPLGNYHHDMTFELPVPPSPNLPDWQAVYLYPSLVLFEGTIVSVGRGTEFPFKVIGHPDYMLGSYVFTPESIPGKSTEPPYMGEQCFGMSLTGIANNYHEYEEHLHLDLLINMYGYFREREGFFNPYFDRLAGSDNLRQMIISGMQEESIRQSWNAGINEFRELRKKYLLYE